MSEIDLTIPLRACGIQRTDVQGRTWIDALAGRASAFGFGFEPIVAAIQAAAEQYLGDGSAFDQLPLADQALSERWSQFVGASSAIRSERIAVVPSPDAAVDQLIGWARQSGDGSRFRTIAFVGSDHGRSGMCRSASGRPELSAGYGPMMAGFVHVPIGDLAGVESVIDDQTVAVLLAPLDFENSGQPIGADFLNGLRALCDQHGLKLLIDESQVTIGSTGQPLAFASIADIHADAAILSAGLFGGLPGGLIVASDQLPGTADPSGANYPLLASVAATTLSAMVDRDLLAQAADSAHQLAVSIAEHVSEFEFVRDIHALGLNLGIETDVDSGLLVTAADHQGLRIEPAGDTAIRIQPPLTMTDSDQQQLLAALRSTLSAVARETAGVAV